MPENEIKIPIGDQIIETAIKQIDSCLMYRQPRLDQIKKSEDVYFGKTRPALVGQFNFPVPILEGYVETLMSKINDTIKIRFEKGRESTLKAAKKVTACWDKDASTERGNFNSADLDAKKLAIFSGFGALKLIPQSKPEYQQTLIAVDYYDLIFEPMGGRDLEKHASKGQLNIFKSKYELEEGVKNGDYDAGQVQKLINNTGTQEKKTSQDEFNNKNNRMLAMNLNPEYHSYLGEDVWNFIELVTRFNGQDYYILFEKASKVWIKCKPLKEMFSSGLSPWASWQIERNPASFLCRSPLDGIRPVAEAMQIILNQSINNIRKRNFDQIAVNIKKVVDLSDFEYRPNGVIRLKLNDGESVDNVFRQVQTPENSAITINLVSWLDNFLGTKSGITPGSQGNSAEEKVGIYYGNMQQVADKYGMMNQFYAQCHEQIAIRYKHNLRDHLPARGFMVKFVGLKGIQEEEVSRDDVNAGLDVVVSSQNAEAVVDLKKQDKRNGALDRIQKDQNLRVQIGDKWLAEQILRTGEYEEDEIKSAMNKEEGSNAELMSEGAKAIEEIIDGQQPKLNRGANIAYIRKIVDYAIEESDSLDDQTFANLMDFAFQHESIAEQNEVLQQKLTQMAYGQTTQQTTALGQDTTANPAIQPAPLPGGQG